MIKYKYGEEKIVALFLADLLEDNLAKSIIQKGGVELPCEGSAQYWTEKLYNSIGGYLERAGHEAQWNEEIDRA